MPLVYWDGDSDFSTDVSSSVHLLSIAFTPCILLVLGPERFYKHIFYTNKYLINWIFSYVFPTWNFSQLNSAYNKLTGWLF